MCELFGMSSRIPASVDFSLDEFARHGGLSASNSDGWGMAFYEGRAARLIREPEPAANSRYVRFIESHGFGGKIVLSHIRHATQGAVTLANTQPFGRELGGRAHIFAHNGDLKGLVEDERFELTCARPIGDTDSEHAFCALFTRLAKLWLASDVPPPAEARFELLVAFACDLREKGPANFIYSDGELMLAHGHRRHRSPDLPPEPPGLWMLHRHCPDEPHVIHIPGMRVSSEGGQEVRLFASVPLSDENWQPLADGECIGAVDGALRFRHVGVRAGPA
jgi:glutamine amidotransferase